jgi:signal peptidase II
MSLLGRLPYVLVMLGVLALDQSTKWLVARSLELHDYRPLIDGFLSLSHVRNRGAAFGILSDADLPYQALLFSALSLVALVAIAVYAWRLPARARLPQFALALILGGALGNLIDRMRMGYVTDFIHVYWKTHQWPDFNSADSAITVGVTLLVLDILLSPHVETSAKAEIVASPAGRTD